MSAQSPSESTFRAYTTTDAELYAQSRQKYSEVLYETLFTHHTSTGGKLGTVVDVGCGPGTATFTLASTFHTTIGLDPSPGMIASARALLTTTPNTTPTSTTTNPPIRFEVATAESIPRTLIPSGTIDLLTAATCAHWFDLPAFYATAARILAPHGTLALWVSRQATVHAATPNAAAINAALRALEAAELLPFFAEGNLRVRDLYAALPMPWDGAEGKAVFAESGFRRVAFGLRGGEDGEGVGEGDDDVGRPFYSGAEERWFDMDTLERMLATSSPVARWREANPEKVGTEEDVVRRLRRTVERLLREAGVEEGKEMVRTNTAGVLLMFKRSG